MKVRIITALVLVAVCCTASLNARAEEDDWRLFIGTYTHGDSQGIYRLTMKKESGELTAPVLAAEVDNPSFLTLHPAGKVLYSVGNGRDERDNRLGLITAFAIDETTGVLQFLNSQDVCGTEPCHVVVSPSQSQVFIANYGNGSVTQFPLNEYGELLRMSGYWTHEGSSVHPSRQQGPHAHSVTFDPTGRYLYVADLGMDQLVLYRINDKWDETIQDKDTVIALEPGSGPRHLAFHPEKPFVYCVNELANTVTLFRHDPDSGALETLQTITTLPGDFTGDSTTAEIRVHPSGSFVYASNRGHDSIAVFKVDAETGQLSSVAQVLTGGRSPRHFSLSPDGVYCVVGNELSNTLRVFCIDPESGVLKDLNQEVSVANAVCVLFHTP